MKYKNVVVKYLKLKVNNQDGITVTKLLGKVDCDSSTTTWKDFVLPQHLRSSSIPPWPPGHYSHPHAKRGLMVANTKTLLCSLMRSLLMRGEKEKDYEHKKGNKTTKFKKEVDKLTETCMKQSMEKKFHYSILPPQTTPRSTVFHNGYQSVKVTKTVCGVFH